MQKTDKQKIKQCPEAYSDSVSINYGEDGIKANTTALHDIQRQSIHFKKLKEAQNDGK